MQHFEIQRFWLKAKNTIAQRIALGIEECTTTPNALKGQHINQIQKKCA